MFKTSLIKKKKYKTNRYKKRKDKENKEEIELKK